MTSQATTRDLNRAYIYAFKKKCDSIYYVRIRQDVLEGSEHLESDEILPDAAKSDEKKSAFHCDGSSECQVCMI